MTLYQVVSRGINPEAVREQVEEKFAQLFKLTPEKSAALLSKRHVALRSNLDEQTANAYCDKLSRIGVNAVVVKMTSLPDVTPVSPAPTGKMSLSSLSLEPLPEEYTKKTNTDTMVTPSPNVKSNMDVEDAEAEMAQSFYARLVDVLRLLIPGPKMIMIFLVVGIAGFWKINGHLPFVAPEGAYNDKGEPEIVFFNFAGCGAPCDNTIKELNKRGLKFRESTILHNTTLSEETIKSSDFKLFEKHGHDILIIGDRSTKDLSTGGLTSLLAQIYGNKYLTESEMEYMKNHFYPDGTPRVYIYGATWCGYCKKLRESLEQEKVDFIELDLDISREKDAITRVMDIPGFPIVYVGYKRLTNGMDVAEIKNSLK